MPVSLQNARNSANMTVMIIANMKYVSRQPISTWDLMTAIMIGDTNAPIEKHMCRVFVYLLTPSVNLSAMSEFATESIIIRPTPSISIYTSSWK